MMDTEQTILFLTENLRNFRRVNDGTSVEIPCAGTFCADFARVDFYELKWRVETNNWDDFDWERLCCHHCQTHNHVGLLEQQWRETTPQLFQRGDFRTDPKKFPAVWQQLRAYGLSMFESTRSAYIYGETGTCKSRMLALLLYHCVAKKNHTFHVFRGGELRVCFERYNISRATGQRNYTDFKDLARNCDVLVFDDFGVDELTANMITALWEILDKRFSSCQITIFLSNLTPDGLLLKYGSSEVMLAMVRRIKEYCIKFTAKHGENSSKENKQSEGKS